MNTAEFINDIPLETAIRAHSGTSWSPEKRGESDRAGYAEQMVSDYEYLAGFIKNKPDLQTTLDSEFARYRDGYRKYYLAKLHSDSRCVSSMIAGPSNFPARRMNKRADTAHKRLGELLEFRKRALDAIRKTLCPELRPIMAGDSDAVARLQENIAEAEKLQEQMKAVNAAHKAFLKDPASLDTSTLPDALKAEVRDYKPAYSWEPHPIAPFQLTNNSANIRRMKERLEKITANRATPATEQSGANARMEDCPSDNRVRLFFPGKPAEEVRSRLKSNGFRWSPTIGAWQAYRNHNALETAMREAGL